MLFTSPSFFLLFLPLFMLVFRLVVRRDRLSATAKLVIIVGTYFFYAFENVGFLIPFAFATVMDLFWSVLLKRHQNERTRKLIVTGSILQNLSILFLFKYLNWVSHVFPNVMWIQELHRAFASETGEIALPPGVSFYLFESMSFVIDCYRRRIDTPKDPLDFLSFITMFPRFIAGPIVRYADLQESIRNYKGPKWANGLFLFALGFVLKILLADSFAVLTNETFGKNFSFCGAWFSALAYTFQLYIDFSAYSMMAIGLGLTLGFPFGDNFREPYLSYNITEFWRRWHISLSTWLRDYLYIPLGGNRKGPWRAYLNLMITMLLGGLWHGANLTFVIWGLYHGLILAIEKFAKERGFELRSRPVAFLLAVFGWVYFRAKTPHEGERMINAMIGGQSWSWRDVQFPVQQNLYACALALIGLLWVFGIEPYVRRKRANQDWHRLEVSAVPWPVLLLVLSLFLVSLVAAFANKNIPFLYFQF